MRVRLQTSDHGALTEVATLQVQEGSARHELQLSVQARVLETSQGTPLLRPDVHCVCSTPAARSSIDEWRAVPQGVEQP